MNKKELELENKALMLALDTLQNKLEIMEDGYNKFTLRVFKNRVGQVVSVWQGGRVTDCVSTDLEKLRRLELFVYNFFENQDIQNQYNSMLDLYKIKIGLEEIDSGGKK